MIVFSCVGTCEGKGVEVSPNGELTWLELSLAWLRSSGTVAIDSLNRPDFQLFSLVLLVASC